MTVSWQEHLASWPRLPAPFELDSAPIPGAIVFNTADVQRAIPTT